MNHALASKATSLNEHFARFSLFRWQMLGEKGYGFFRELGNDFQFKGMAFAGEFH